MQNPQPTPRQEILWSPHPGPQTRFLASVASEALYGGSAGGGKSAASIALPLRWVDNPSFRCLFLRREAKYLADALDKSNALYPKLGARLVQSPKTIWTFPSGAKIWLNHCEHENDVANYDSLEFHLVVFEELTHFTEKQYRGIRARIRGTDPTLPRFSRATSNPGGEGHDWVLKRFGAWLDPTHATSATTGELRWYRGDDEVQRGTPDALSRTFIPARLSDNPSVTADYRAQLLDLDPVRRAQLLDGNWLIKPAAGLYFKRGWMPVIDSAPHDDPIVSRVRYWDRASTEGGGDWTVGAKVARTSKGLYLLEDVVRAQKAPGGVEALIRETAERDGHDVPILLEQDPGQAGKFEAEYYRREFAGWNIRAIPKRVNKITAASPLSAQAAPVGASLHGNVRLIRGAWNETALQELESFPDGDHDDIVDAASGGFGAVAKAAPSLSALDQYRKLLPRPSH